MKFISALAAALCVAFNAHAAPLPPAVKQALKQTGIPQSAVGIVVQQTGGHKPLISLNAKQAMNPASTIHRHHSVYWGLKMLPLHRYSPLPNLPESRRRFPRATADR